jgi:hypothetical protein
MAKCCGKEGAFNMMGILADIVVADHSYKKLMVEQFERLVFPEFANCGQ